MAFRAVFVFVFVFLFVSLLLLLLLVLVGLIEELGLELEVVLKTVVSLEVRGGVEGWDCGGFDDDDDDDDDANDNGEEEEEDGYEAEVEVELKGGDGDDGEGEGEGRGEDEDKGDIALSEAPAISSSIRLYRCTRDSVRGNVSGPE